MAVITMSRQVGSGAIEVAERLCKDLGLAVFDKRLMMRVASETGLSEAEMVDYSEDQYKHRNFLARLFRGSRPVAEVSSWAGGRDAGYERQVRVLDEEAAINLIRAAVNAAYERDNVLILGRGGQAILEDRPKVIHVRIVAPFEARLENIQAQEHMSVPQARRFIYERDNATRQYLQTFYHIDVDDPTLYHLTLNAAKLGIDGCVALIKAMVESVEKAGEVAAAA